MNTSIEDRAHEWLAGRSTGASARAIHDKMTERDDPITKPSTSHPHDIGDFNRCLKLLEIIPEWRDRLCEMQSVNRYWQVFSDNWNAFETLSFAGDHMGFKILYIKLIGPIEDADPNVVRLGAGITMTIGG